MLVKLRHGGMQGFYAAYRSATGVLVLRSSGDSVTVFVPDKCEAVPLSPERLPIDLFAWRGTVPAFTFSSPEQLSKSEYESRVIDQRPEIGWTETLISFRVARLSLISAPGEKLKQAYLIGADPLNWTPCLPMLSFNSFCSRWMQYLVPLRVLF